MQVGAVVVGKVVAFMGVYDKDAAYAKAKVVLGKAYNKIVKNVTNIAY